jgi:hypothetical protein
VITRLNRNCLVTRGGVLQGVMLFATLVVMLLGVTPSFAQDLFGEQEMKPPLTEAQKAAGERESIF